MTDPLEWLRPRFIEVEDAEPGPYKLRACERLELPGESVEVGDRSFKAIEVDPEAMALLTGFRIVAEERKRADERFGALWARAFENAVKIAGLSALGYSLGDQGPCAPEIDGDDAQFGIALVKHSLAQLAGDLHENLADHEAECQCRTNFPQKRRSKFP